MIRTLVAAGALAALAGAAHAQGYSSYDPGLTVYGQPRDAYVIRIDTRGKDDLTIRREITWAAYEACRLAPRTNNPLEVRPTAMSTCVGAARNDAIRQLNALQDRRMRSGYIYTASYDYSE